MQDQADYFLKIDGIEGESQDSKHKGEIQIRNFEFGVANRGRRGDYKVGKAVFDDARFYAYVEQSYPKLQLACATAEPITKAVLTCRKAGKLQQDYLKITFSDIRITNCKLNTADTDTMPIVEFTIGFTKKQIDYREQKQDGSLGGTMSGTVDLKANTVSAS